MKTQHLIAQVLSSLTLNSDSFKKDLYANGEVENITFYPDKEYKNEYIRINLHEDGTATISYVKKVRLDELKEDASGAMQCSRELKDWSDYQIILAVKNANIDFWY